MWVLVIFHAFRGNKLIARRQLSPADRLEFLSDMPMYPVRRTEYGRRVLGFRLDALYCWFHPGFRLNFSGKTQLRLTFLFEVSSNALRFGKSGPALFCLRSRARDS